MGTLASSEDPGEISKLEFALFGKTTQSSEKEIQHFFLNQNQRPLNIYKWIILA